MGRVGVSGDRDAIAASVPEPIGLEAKYVEIEGETLLVLSFPVPSATLPASLTAAEREITLAVLAGRSNREIARVRGTAERTIANQVAAIYRKLQVRSRTELGRRFGG